VGEGARVRGAGRRARRRPLCPASAVEQYARAIEAARQQAIPAAATPASRARPGQRAARQLRSGARRHEAALAAARVTGDRQAEWQALLTSASCGVSRLRSDARLLRRCTRPGTHARRSTGAGAQLEPVGNWYVNMGQQPRASGSTARRWSSSSVSKTVAGSPRRSTSWLGQLRAGQPVDAVGYLDRAIALFRASTIGQV